MESLKATTDIQSGDLALAIIGVQNGKLLHTMLVWCDLSQDENESIDLFN